MSRIPPKPLDTISGPARDRIEKTTAIMGFLPNSLLAMAHKPRIMEKFMDLALEINGVREGPLYRTKVLCSHVVSNMAGCRYCQAHTAKTALSSGIPESQLLAAFEYETSDQFTDAEKAAINVAFKAGMSPNAVEDEDFVRLRQFYTDEEATEIMAMISLFGFLNRWNDSLATTLEEAPMQKAGPVISQVGWEPGKHR